MSRFALLAKAKRSEASQQRKDIELRRHTSLVVAGLVSVALALGSVPTNAYGRSQILTPDGANDLHVFFRPPDPISDIGWEWWKDGEKVGDGGEKGVKRFEVRIEKDELRLALVKAGNGDIGLEVTTPEKANRLVILFGYGPPMTIGWIWTENREDIGDGGASEGPVRGVRIEIREAVLVLEVIPPAGAPALALWALIGLGLLLAASLAWIIRRSVVHQLGSR